MEQSKKKKNAYDKLIGKWLSINTFTKFSSTNAKHPPVTALSVFYDKTSRNLLPQESVKAIFFPICKHFMENNQRMNR